MGDYHELDDVSNADKSRHADQETGLPPTIDERELNTGDGGLTTAEAERRLARDGPNCLPESKQNPFLKFLGYYWGPMPAMIWIAIIIEGARQDFPDFGVLLFLQFVNGFVGWKEERNAGNAIEALKAKLAPQAKCKRDGKWSEIDAQHLVIGDRVNIKLGDIIPSDCMLGPGFAEVDQSALNGESLPAEKHQGDTVYQGSVVKKGDLEAIVCATGAKTFFGKTSALVGAVRSVGNFQKVLWRVTLVLLITAIVLVIIIFIVLMTRGQDVLQTLGICVVLLVASIPIAMQVVCTTTMAVGAHRLAQRQAIVSRLSSTEELAGLDILCSDKTGTLTKNILTVQDPRANPGFTGEELLLAAALAAKRDGAQDAIDKCIVEEAKRKYNISFDEYEEEGFVPFDPVIKRVEATIRNTRTGETFRVCKGAPQVVLSLSVNMKDIEEDVSEAVNSLARGGYRTIGVGRTNQKGEWIMQGLIPLFDPPRDDTKETIKKAQQMDINVKMITGDQLAIAIETAKLLDMGDKIYNAEMLSENATITQQQMLDSIIENSDGFAEVFPEHKFAIVKILQEQKQKRVGMTGDGVNDAPALKKADVGIAVEGSTDAARGAADIVLTSPGLSIIIEAVYRSRKIFQRMKNYCTYRIACTMQLLLFFFISMIFIDPSGYTSRDHVGGSDLPSTFALPVITLVIITVLNDGTIISIAYDRVTVSQKPEKWHLPVIFMTSGILGLVATMASVIMVLLCLANMNGSHPSPFFDAFGIPTFGYGEVLTIMYLQVSLLEYLTVFAARTHSWFFSRPPGKGLGCAFLVALTVTTILAGTVQMNDGTSKGSIPIMQVVIPKMLFFVWFYNFIFFIIQDVCKVMFLRALVSHYNKQEGGDGKVAHGVYLTETFLKFETGEGAMRRGSIVTRRSIAAARS